MAEEAEAGGGSIKSILIGLISTITIGVGGYITNKLTGDSGEDKTEVAAPAAAPVINITNTNQQSQQAAGKTIIIKEKASPSQAAPAVIAKPKKTETEKRKEDGLDW